MPFLPIKDDNPLRLIRFQAVTVTLIVLCALVFLWQQSLSQQALWEAWVGYGLIPAVLTDEAIIPPELVRIPAWLSLVTSMFLHSGYFHLGGNMLFLWVFGDNIEDATGHAKFLVFFLTCGVIAGLCEILSGPESTVPIVGASGAIAGVLGAYLMLHPRRRMLVLIVRAIPIYLHVGIVLVGWIIFQVGAGVWFAGEGGSDIAWWAHVGGFVAGAALIPLFKRPDVPLFDQTSVVIHDFRKKT
ncbi:MAG: rhomboid family intramembrane serine protease [Rhodospirillales bacterium]|nr:rhomboid family intramembrane serine protease [Rhodospirillales bacterium]